MFYKHNAEQGQMIAPGIHMQLLCYGERTLMARFTLTHGSILPPHTHPHEQTGMLLSGHVRFNINGVLSEATPGDAWCIPGGIVHSVEVIEGSVIVEVFSPVREEYLPSKSSFSDSSQPPAKAPLMRISTRERFRQATSAWGHYIWILASSVFLIRLGQGLMGGISTNFYADVLGLSGREVLWLAGIREIPGLSLMFIAALVMHLPLSRRAALSVLLMGLGYGLYATVHSYTALIVTALVGSLGFHNWMPLQSALGLALTERERSGQVLGLLSAMGSFASIVGMGITAALAMVTPLRTFYVVAGGTMLLAALVLFRIPTEVGTYDASQPRIILRKRYWLYYILIFFEGSRMQVFGTFGTLILVQNYGLDARAISLIMIVSGTVNFLLAPRVGRLLDHLGERTVLSTSYAVLALCFMGYATLHNVWLLSLLLIGINFLVTLRIGLSTYVNRIAPPEEVAPTLAAGVSINHLTSVSASLLAGTLLNLVGYEKLCWGASAIIMFSVPFALAMKIPAKTPQPTPQAQPTP